MSWFKMLRYDLRHGLLRWRYLCVPALFCVACYDGWIRISNAELVGSWMDYLMACFKGILPLSGGMEGFEFPILWFLIMGGHLILDLDYPLNDLTEAGRQVIIRCGSKKGWFLSKCVWSLLSSGLYLLLGAGTALLFALATGGAGCLVNTPAVTGRALMIVGQTDLTAAQAVMAAVVLPYLTIAAFGLLQMALGLLMKPIFAFLTCVCILVVSMFFSTPLIPGNGAMVARSSILTEGAVPAGTAALVCLAVILGSVIAGVIRFQYMDHLRNEE